MKLRRFSSAAALAYALLLTVPAMAAASGKWHVFILSGQSNMQGKGAIAHLEQLLAHPATAPEYAHLRKDGVWTERDDVLIRYADGQKREQRGPLTVGYGTPENRFGPELQFGQVVGDVFDETVLLIKVCWGGKSLRLDFRPPSSGPGDFEADWLAKQAERSKFPGAPQEQVGFYYRELVRLVNDTLEHLPEYFPQYDNAGYTLDGFVWFQGWNDMIDGNHHAEYGPNLANLIRDLRKDLNAPKLPMAVGELGQSGPESEIEERVRAKHMSFRAQQECVSRMPEFKDTVRYVKTSPYIVKEEPHFDGGYHYSGRADTFFHIGQALGEAALELCGAAPFPGEKSAWNGYARYDFTVAGRACCVVLPKEAPTGKPWIWRARFFGHEPQTDLALLARGFHLAYMDVADLFGAPKAVEAWNAFYVYLTQEHGFAPKVALEGMSRGGLIIFNWAEANPEKTACIYADAPVCDIKSWPGGKGAGEGSPDSWKKCLEAYGLTEAEALIYAGNPIDNLASLAKAGVPLLHVCGAADDVVPMEENTNVIESRYRAMGGDISVIAKEGVGHHPHSLEDPAVIADFILRNTVGTGDFFTLRDGLDNCRLRFTREKTGRVAFLGGSITNMSGWRDMVIEELQRRFHETKFDFISAGIPSMGSTPGAFRLSRDVLSKGRVDLLFQEAAVNDSTNGRSAVDWVRGVEGIVRHARAANPEMDIVLMHFVDPDKMASYRRGEVPPVIAAHEQVAEYYALPSINLALEVTHRIEAGEFTWEKDFKGLHPAPFGQKLYFSTISRLLDAAWKEAPAETARITAHAAPKAPLDDHSYDRARLAPIGDAEYGPGWQIVQDWRPGDGAGTREGFVDVPMLTADTPGAELRFSFTGRAVGIFVAAGPDAGSIAWRIDGGPMQERDLFTQWSARLHLPWAHVLDADLDGGAHVLTLRVGEAKNPASTGHAVRIAHFLVNE